MRSFWRTTLKLLRDNLGAAAARRKTQNAHDKGYWVSLGSVYPITSDLHLLYTGGIMELTLTAEESELLVNILEQHHRQLSNEIFHTDHRDFKEVLREKQELLESVLNRLRLGSRQELQV
jgi:hypothetical protein